MSTAIPPIEEDASAYDAVSRLTAWVRDFGKDHSPEFVQDIEDVLTCRRRLLATLHAVDGELRGRCVAAEAELKRLREEMRDSDLLLGIGWQNAVKAVNGEGIYGH